MAGYEVFDDPYCYPGTFVLKNKAGIKDAASLEAFELEMSTLRAEESLPDGNFSPAHYRKVIGTCFRMCTVGPDETERCAPAREAIRSAIQSTSTAR